MNKKQITDKMQSLGMAWANSSSKHVNPNDVWGAKPSYHVHPDTSYPHQNSVKCFATLGELAEYIAAREKATGAGGDAGFEIMQDYEYSCHMRV